MTSWHGNAFRMNIALSPLYRWPPWIWSSGGPVVFSTVCFAGVDNVWSAIWDNPSLFWVWSMFALLLKHIEAETNGRHFADDIFKCIFLNENVWIPIKLSLKFVPKGPINNIPAMVQIMAWRRPGDKPLFEPMMVSLPTHICVARLQWVKASCLYNGAHSGKNNTRLEFGFDVSFIKCQTVVHIYFR